MPHKAKNKDAAAANPSDTETKAAESTKPRGRRRQARRTVQAARPGVRSRKKRTRIAARASRRGRVRYSDAERQKILDAARREGLTGAQVHDRFGVSTLTYYTWRKKAKTPRGRRPGRPARRNAGDFSGQIREAIRAKVREMLPEIIAQEIGTSLGGQSYQRTRRSVRLRK